MVFRGNVVRGNVVRGNVVRGNVVRGTNIVLLSLPPFSAENAINSNLLINGLQNVAGGK
jgi:hypothetical protein